MCCETPPFYAVLDNISICTESIRTRDWNDLALLFVAALWAYLTRGRNYTVVARAAIRFRHFYQDFEFGEGLSLVEKGRKHEHEVVAPSHFIRRWVLHSGTVESPPNHVLSLPSYSEPRFCRW